MFYTCLASGIVGATDLITPGLNLFALSFSCTICLFRIRKWLMVVAKSRGAEAGSGGEPSRGATGWRKKVRQNLPDGQCGTKNQTIIAVTTRPLGFSRYGARLSRFPSIAWVLRTSWWIDGRAVMSTPICTRTPSRHEFAKPFGTHAANRFNLLSLRMS